MTQEELFKALRGERRTQVDLNLGQVPISPTIQSGGNYNVVVAPVSRQNSATRLSAVLAQVPQVAGQFKNIQEQAGIREANELTPDEVIRRVESGDVEAQGILAAYGKEKTFQEQLYARYFTNTLQPAFVRVENEMRNLTASQIAEIGDVRSYAQQKFVESIDPDVYNTLKDPKNRFMAVKHNLAMEALIPKLVEATTGSAELKKSAYTRESTRNNLQSALSDTNTFQGVVEDEAPSGAIYVEKATAFGPAGIDGTTAKEITDGTMARVGGDPKRGSSGMLYRGLEDEIPTVAVHKSSGLKAKDYIKVTSDLFPEGRIFQVAGTGPAAGRLDFYSTNKEDYNKLAYQKLQSVVKVDKDGNELVVKAKSNISRIIEVEAAESKRVGISNEEIISDVSTGLGARADSYIAYGDLEKTEELLELIESEEIKVGGKALIKTVQGRVLATRIREKLDAEEEKQQQKDSQILSRDSKRNENIFSARIARVLQSLPENPTPQQKQEAIEEIDGIRSELLNLQEAKDLDAATYRRLSNDMEVAEDAINTGTMRQTAQYAQMLNTYEGPHIRTISSIETTFGTMTDSTLGVVSEVLGRDYVTTHTIESSTYGGKTDYSLQLKNFVKSLSASAREITTKQLINTLSPEDPDFRKKYEQAFAANFKELLEDEKAPEAPVAPTTTADAMVRDELKRQSLAPTDENIRMVQNQLLAETPNTPSGKLFNRQYQLKENFEKLESIQLLRAFNGYVGNRVLRDRTNLTPSQVASVAVTASNKALKQSFSNGIFNALDNAPSPIKKAQIRQNWILDYVKNVGLPVAVLEGDMMTNHNVGGGSTDPTTLGIRTAGTVLPLDFDNGDRYFKRYKTAVMSAEALVGYGNGNKTLLDRVFNAGVARGQLNENQKEDFINSQLELGRKIGILEPLTQNNEQQ